MRRLLAGESGSLVVVAALVLTLFMALVGFGVDYGLFLLQRANAQNAADAASLAGSRWLLAGTNPGTAAASAAATQYLAAYGYQTNAQTTITFSFPPSPVTGATDRMQVAINRQQPAYFAQLAGIRSFSVQTSATAVASRSLTDVALSLDLTGSMELSGTNDLAQLRSAVVQFIDQINPDPNDPESPQVAMARFAGVMCGWNRSGPTERTINLGPGTSEYVGPCSDDKTVLTNLTRDKATLTRLADNSGSGNCPSGMSIFACPLVSWTYVAPVVNGPAAVPQGMTYNGASLGSYQPSYTGTKLPNAISVLSNSSYYAWSTANGGRSNAHKVLVMMTDGNDELWPEVGMPAGNNTAAWDAEVVQRANALKLGPDGIAGTADDVEIYVVGFYCTPYSTSTTIIPDRWCTSRMADTAAPHPCPSAVWDASFASPIDGLLHDISSSSPGTCDHYFPLKKSESLPATFTQLAGDIARGRLIS